MKNRTAILLAALILVLGLSAVDQPSARSPPRPPAPPSRSRSKAGGGGGSTAGAGDRFGNLLSGWGVPAITALAGCLLIGALATRNIGASVGIIAITLLSLIFLLAPQSVETFAKGIANVVFWMAARETKVVRSYRLVFRRRWRIFRIGNWRIPLPGGLELRLIGYWLACLATIALLARLPLDRPAASRRCPRRCACSRSRCSPPGRSAAGSSTAARRTGPLLGLAGWWLRPRVLAAGRRVPAPGTELSPLGARGPRPRPRIVPTAGRPDRRPRPSPAPLSGRRPAAEAARVHVRRRPGPALHKGHVLEVPRGHARRLRGGRSVRAPHHFLTGNLILRTPTDAWAIYELEGQSYPGLPDARKIEVGERLEALAYVLETDFQILRISRAFDAAAYEQAALSTLDPRHGRREAFAAPPRRAPRACSRSAARPAPRSTSRSASIRARRGALAGLFDDLAAAWRAARRPPRPRGRRRDRPRRPRGDARRRGGGPRAGARLPRRPPDRPAPGRRA